MIVLYLDGASKTAHTAVCTAENRASQDNPFEHTDPEISETKHTQPEQTEKFCRGFGRGDGQMERRHLQGETKTQTIGCSWDKISAINLYLCACSLEGILFWKLILRQVAWGTYKEILVLAQRKVLYLEIFFFFFQGISRKVYACRAKEKRKKLGKGQEAEAREGMRVLPWRWTSWWCDEQKGSQTSDRASARPPRAPGGLRGRLASGQGVRWVWFVGRRLKCCFMTWAFWKKGRASGRRLRTGEKEWLAQSSSFIAQERDVWPFIP